MNNAHNFQEEQKNQQNEMKRNEMKWKKNLAFLGLAVQVEYLSNLWS